MCTSACNYCLFWAANCYFKSNTAIKKNKKQEEQTDLIVTIENYICYIS